MQECLYYEEMPRVSVNHSVSNHRLLLIPLWNIQDVRVPPAMICQATGGKSACLIRGPFTCLEKRLGDGRIQGGIVLLMGLASYPSLGSILGFPDHMICPNFG